MRRGKKNKGPEEETENNNTAERALKIRGEMLLLFDDLKHDPNNPQLLSSFHEKCLDFNRLLKKVNKQYESQHTDLGIFQTKN